MPRLQQQATIAMSQAAARDANEAYRDALADSEFIRER
jgi:hypothetical protein